MPGRPIPAGRAVITVGFEGALGDGPGTGPLARVRAGGAPHALLATGPATARELFPCLDDPAFRAPFDLTLVLPVAWRSAWITSPVGEEPAGPGRKRVRHASTPPLPTHLLLAVAGPFARVDRPPLAASAPRQAVLPLRGLAPPGSESHLAPALEAVRALLPALEALLDAPYPVGAVGLALLPGLAEPLGAPGLLVLPDVVDGGAAPVGTAQAGGGVGLGLARGWFGGVASAAHWPDVWADEALAAFAGATAARAWGAGEAAGREVAAVDAALESQLWPGARALRPPVNRVSDLPALTGPAVRARGAALLRAWERALGQGRFREVLHAWLLRPGGARSTDDLETALSQVAGRDVGPALRALTGAPGVVRLEVRAACDDAGPRLELAVGRARLPGAAWSPPAPPGGLPVCARYEAAGALGEACTVMEGGRAALALPSCPRWVMPAAGGVVPWRWLPAPADRAHLREAGFLHLTAPERLAWALGLRAAARAGELPMSEALASLAPLTRDGDPQVAEVAPPLFIEAVDQLLPRPLLASARTRVAELFRPRLRELGLDPAAGDGAERVRLRRAVAELMVVTARRPGGDPSLRGARPGLGGPGRRAPAGRTRSRPRWCRWPWRPPWRRVGRWPSTTWRRGS